MRRLRHLHLGSNNLEALPSFEPHGVPSLETLEAPRNRIAAVPPRPSPEFSARTRCPDPTPFPWPPPIACQVPPRYFARLPGLRRLMLGRNELQALEGCGIGGCSQLAWLQVEENALSSLPAELGQCSQLQVPSAPTSPSSASDDPLHLPPISPSSRCCRACSSTATSCAICRRRCVSCAFSPR